VNADWNHSTRWDWLAEAALEILSHLLEAGLALLLGKTKREGL
jgi:hypothetical protein